VRTIGAPDGQRPTIRDLCANLEVRTCRPSADQDALEKLGGDARGDLLRLGGELARAGVELGHELLELAEDLYHV
jgi:hypothetical protein